MLCSRKRVCWLETWSLGGEHKQVIPCFSYVGANFTRQLSLTQIAKEQLVKETRILNSILSKLYQYSQLRTEVFFKIFDTKICPILSHGSELWGIEKQIAIERMQTYACKRYMCVNLKTSNDAVLGYCGRYPMYIDGIERCLSYWLKVQDHCYVRKCYNTISVVRSGDQGQVRSGDQDYSCSMLLYHVIRTTCFHAGGWGSTAFAGHSSRSMLVFTQN